jgi:hypothetical protein
MRELTFNGFLKQYVYALSAGKTHSLYKLAHEAATTNTRLQEPLFLYALFFGKERVLLQATKNPDLRNKYQSLLELYSKDIIEHALLSSSPILPERYLRVYASYTRLRMRKENNNHIKTLMYNEIRRLQEEKSVSNYRLYTDLKLNPSNVNSFLKHGRVGKVSQNTASKILSYLETCA